MKNVGLLVIVIAVFSCGTANAERTIWYVHPDSALNSIQAGLDSCADNDIVLVGPGTYYENIVWPNTRWIQLNSELGRDTTIIDGSNTASVIRVEPVSFIHSAVIRGFTIRNGNDGSLEGGGGIYAVSGPESFLTRVLYILDNTISNNSALCGGGISFRGLPMVSSGFVNISGNIITNNDATIDGGAIYIRGWADANIYDNTITYNTARNGGGIFSQVFEDFYEIVTISNNIISYNSAIERGGGIGSVDNVLLYGFVGNIVSNMITENSAGYGGGISASVGYVYDNTITHNIASVDGGAMVVHQSYGTYIGNNAITYNSAANSGDGICAGTWSSTDVTIVSNDIHSNGCGLYNPNIGFTFNAENNWWGDASGPYHPTANPGGLGDSVSDYVDFDPWLSWPVGVEERPIVKPVEQQGGLTATIFRGPLQLPKDKKCRVYDITGRVVEPDKIQPGIYFIEVDGVVTQKVVKVR